MTNLKRKISVTLLSLVMVLSAFAALNAPVYAAASDITVYTTIDVEGNTVTGDDGTFMAQVPVTVSDIDADGIITIDEVLQTVHNKHKAGGYASSNTDYFSITKLWGNESGWFGYYLNHAPVETDLSQQVKDGDQLTAFVYKVQRWGGKLDTYAFFTQNTATATEGDSIEFTLNKVEFDDTYAPVNVAAASEKVRVLNLDGTTVSDVTYTTDENGKVTIQFDKAGTYIVQCYTDTNEQPIVPNVCKVTVAAAEKPSADDPADDPSDDEGTSTVEDNTKDKTKDSTKKEKAPETGDASDMAVWLVLLLGASACTAGLKTRQKNK